MKNSTYIKDNYKLSTIPRMKELYKFKSLKEIDDCEEVSRALESVGKIPHIQEVLFDRIDCEFKTTDVQQFVNTL